MNIVSVSMEEDQMYTYMPTSLSIETHPEKTGSLHMRKQILLELLMATDFRFRATEDTNCHT